MGTRKKTTPGQVRKRLNGTPIFYTKPMLDSSNLTRNVELYLSEPRYDVRKELLARPHHRLLFERYNHPYHRESNVMTDADLRNEAVHLIANRILVLRYVLTDPPDHQFSKTSTNVLNRGESRLLPLIEYREGNEHKIVYLSKVRRRFRHSTFTFRNKSINWYEDWENLIRRRVLNEVQISPSP